MTQHQLGSQLPCWASSLLCVLCRLTGHAWGHGQPLGDVCGISSQGQNTRPRSTHTPKRGCRKRDPPANGTALEPPPVVPTTTAGIIFQQAVPIAAAPTSWASWPWCQSILSTSMGFRASPLSSLRFGSLTVQPLCHSEVMGGAQYTQQPRFRVGT